MSIREVGTGEVRVVQAGVLQPDTREIGAREIGAREIGVGEVGPDEIRSAEIDTLKLRARASTRIHHYRLPSRAVQCGSYAVQRVRRYVRVHKRDVTDPQGAAWRLTLEWQMVSTAALKRAISRSGKTFRKPRFWERGRTEELGVKPEPGPGVFYFAKFRPATRWERDHSEAWVVVASTHGPPPQQRAWISPAMREADAQFDLDELAGRVERGEDPRPAFGAV